MITVVRKRAKWAKQITPYKTQKQNKTKNRKTKAKMTCWLNQRHYINL